MDECREGESNCCYICVLTILKTCSGIIPYKEDILKLIVIAKYC